MNQEERKKYYTPGKSYSFLIDNGIIVLRDEYRTSGYRVEQYGKEKKVYEYRQYDVKNKYWYTTIKVKHLGRSESINAAQLVFLQFIGNIPEGYVVDHIDNDHLNLWEGNLQLLLREENCSKKAKREIPDNIPNLLEELLQKAQGENKRDFIGKVEELIQEAKFYEENKMEEYMDRCAKIDILRQYNNLRAWINSSK